MAGMTELWKQQADNLIASVSLSRIGDRVAFGSWDNNIYFYKRSGDLAWKKKTDDYVSGVDVSGDGNSIAVGSFDRNVYLLNSKGEEIWKYDARDFVRSVAINEDGDKVLAGTWNGDLVLLSKAGKALWTKRLTGNVLCVDMDRDGTLLAAGSMDKKVRLFDVSGKELWSFETGGYVSRVRISADGNFVVVGSRDTFVYFFERNGGLLWKFKTGGLITGLAVSDMGETVTVGSHDSFIFHLERLGKLLWVHKTDGEIWDLDCTDLGNIIAIGTKQKLGYLMEQSDAVDERLTFLDKVSEDVKAIGADIAEAGKFLDKAKKLKGGKDLEGLTEAVQNASRSFEKAKIDFLRSKANEALMALEEELGKIDNKDVTMLDLLIKRARELYEEKRYDRVSKLSKRGLELIPQLPELVEEALVEEKPEPVEPQDEETAKEVRKAERTVAAAEKSGIDLTEAKDLLEQARKELDAGNMDMAKEMAQEAIKSANAAKAPPAPEPKVKAGPDPLVAEIDELEASLGELKGDEADSAKDFLTQARDAVGEGDKEMASDFVSQAREIVTKLQTEAAKAAEPKEEPKKVVPKRKVKKDDAARCPKCNKKVRPEWTSCAYCRASLK
jgi:tetratricopeptide (TPR) repeat protein